MRTIWNLRDFVKTVSIKKFNRLLPSATWCLLSQTCCFVGHFASLRVFGARERT